MFTLNLPKSVIAVILAAMICAPGAAQAGECRLFGTGPFCAGSCPAGWKLLQRRGSNCVTGSKALCCQVDAPCTRYGTPACPYPSFGKRQKLPQAQSCGSGMFKGKDGQCYPLLH
jgi:hypothetical protein